MVAPAIAAAAVPVATALIGAAAPGIVKGAATAAKTKRDELEQSKKKGGILGVARDVSNPLSNVKSIGAGANAMIDRLAAGDEDDRVAGGQIVHLNPVLNIKIRKLTKPATEQFERDKNGKIVETAGLLPMIGGALMGPVGGVLGGVVENPDAPAHAAAGGMVGGMVGEGIGKAVTPMAVSGAQNAGSAISSVGKPVGEGINAAGNWLNTTFGGGAANTAAAGVPTAGPAIAPYSPATPPGVGVTDAGANTGAVNIPQPAPTPSTPPQAPVSPTASTPPVTSTPPLKPLGTSIGEGIKGAGEFVGKWGAKAAEAVTTPLATGMGASMGSSALANEQKKKGTATGIPSIQDECDNCDQDILDRFLAKQ